VIDSINRISKTFLNNSYLHDCKLPNHDCESYYVDQCRVKPDEHKFCSRHNLQNCVECGADFR
jgi:hypothetical protein